MVGGADPPAGRPLVRGSVLSDTLSTTTKKGQGEWVGSLVVALEMNSASEGGADKSTLGGINETHPFLRILSVQGTFLSKRVCCFLLLFIG